MSIRTLQRVPSIRRLPYALAGIVFAAPALASSGSWSTTGPYGGRVYQLVDYEAGPGTLWAAGGGGLFRSTSSGASWQRLINGLPASAFVWGLAASTSSPVLYASSRSQLFRSGNGGDLWITLGTPPAADSIVDIAVRRPTADDVAILTSNGAWVSTSGGSGWTGSVLPSANCRNIEFAADGALYIGLWGSDPSVYGGAVLLKSNTGGASWTPVAIPSTPWGAMQMASSPVDPQRLFLSDGGILVTSSNGGASWADVALPTGCGEISALTPHPGQAPGLFIGCTRLGVATTSNVDVPVWTSWGISEGLTVNGVDPLQASAIQVHPAWPSTQTLFVGSEDGGLLRSTDGGASWNEINHGYEATMIRALAIHPVDSGSSAVVLAGYGDSNSTTHAIHKSPDGGATWAPSHAGLEAEQIRGLAIDPTTTDNDPFTAENFTAYAAGRSMPFPDVADQDAGLYKSTDGGVTWSTIDNGIAIVDGVRTMGIARAIVPDPRSCAAPPPGGPCPIGSGPLQTLFAVGSGRMDTAAAGLPYLSARIYRSANAGTSWSPSEAGLPLPQDIDPGAGISLVGNIGIIVAIDPTDSQTMYVGTTLAGEIFKAGMSEPTIANGVFKSTDGGASWTHASNGLPRYFGPASSQRDVLALAINPVNPQVLLAGVTAFLETSTIGRVYKSTNGGASWSEASNGISGQDVRALFIDPADPTGDTIYAGTGGDGANHGGVYRSTDGGATWNSFSIGLPAYSATALAMPARATGAPARILAGTNAGVWDYTEVPDEDADGAPSEVENGVLAGDGNDDGTPDAQQASVASLTTSTGAATQPAGGSVSATIEIASTSACSQLNDSIAQPASLFPPDPLGDGSSHEHWGLVNFALPGCGAARVRVRFHGASFGPGWTWRNYGPRIPGDDSSFGWYTFAGAQRIDAQTWELTIDALRQGNYRADPDNILFIGGPGLLPDLLFDNDFE